MEKYGLLGRQLGHSLSPFIHEILFEISGVKAEYKLYQTENIKDFLQNISLDGFNVTIPYKKDIFDLCKNLHSSAKNIGSVNCVDRSLTGYNTDIYGYTKSVSELEGDFCSKVLLLGCGGVGSMIAKQYKTKNLTIAIRNTTCQRVSEIKNQFEDVRVVDILNIPQEEFDLICNSTSVGMFPEIGNSPITKEVVSRCRAVYDVIYNPYQTMLLKYANELGIKNKNGLEMLVLQAAKSHEYWYGGVFKDNDISQIIQLAKKELEKKW